MANTKSSAKRAHVAEVRRQRNAARRSAMRTAVKKCWLSVEHHAEVEPHMREELLRDAMRKLDKAARKGIIHPNQAARRKSQLSRRMHTLTG